MPFYVLGLLICAAYALGFLYGFLFGAANTHKKWRSFIFEDVLLRKEVRKHDEECIRIAARAI